MMKLAPAATFAVAQAQFLLARPVVALDQPALLALADEFGKSGVLREIRPPRLDRFCSAVQPLDEEPVLGPSAGRRTHAHGSEAQIKIFGHGIAEATQPATCSRVIKYHWHRRGARGASFGTGPLAPLGRITDSF